MAAVGAEIVLRNLRAEAGGAQLGINILNKALLLVKEPAGEEALADNFLAGVAALFADGVADLAAKSGSAAARASMAACSGARTLSRVSPTSRRRS